MAAYTTIDDPSEHCKGLNFTGDLDDRQKRSYGGNADSYVPDIFLVKNMTSSSHSESTDSVATGGFTTAYEQASYGRRGMQTIALAETDGYTMGADGQANGQGSDIMALTWNCGSTATIESYYPSGDGYGNNRTSVSASGNAPAHYYTANTTAKQSVVFYEGTGSSGLEIPHHLGVKPTFAMFKKMGEGTYDQTNYYDGGNATFYKDMTANGNADGDPGGHHGSGWYYAPSGSVGSGSFFSAAPDSTKFTLGSHGYTNTDDYDFICYCFSDLQGYFKTGFYEGNGSADGPFVHTGFEPEMILINAQDNGSIPYTHGNLGHSTLDYYGGWYWFINGATTNGFNPHDKTWNWPNSNAMTDYDQDALDIYSNGFKIRAPGGDESGGWQGGNQNDKTVWYAAWAKHPLVTSGGVPATAR